MSSAAMEPVAVLGAGSWGTALALLLAGDRTDSVGGEVRLWDRTPALADALARDRENRRYLPGFALPPFIRPTADLAHAIRDARLIVVAVPSHAVRDVLGRAAPHLDAELAVDMVLAAKGMESGGLLPAEVAHEALGTNAFPQLALVALSGPNLAAEIARGVPAAAVAACPGTSAAQRVAVRFGRPAFRVYTSRDRLGVEVGGAVKNVLAIAGGVSDGLGYGDNTKAALLTRGLAEMARLGEALGARRETFYGLAGVGDLLATASSRLSRNFRVGEGLAQGVPLPEILARLGQVAEGVTTARAVAALAERTGTEVPVCQTVARLLDAESGLSPADAVAALLARPQTGE